MKKGDICEGRVERVDFPNRGRVICGTDQICVKNVAPGQLVRFRVSKKRSSGCEGVLLEVLEAAESENRQKLCRNFPDCGGCTYQTLSYEAQLAMKADQVQRLLAPVLAGAPAPADIKDVFCGIFHSEREYPYRNKMEFTFGDEEKGGPLTLGLHRKGSNYDILPIEDCAIVHEDMNRIVRCVQEYCRKTELPIYRKNDHSGYLRNLLVRRAEATGEILVALVTTTALSHDFSDLVENLRELSYEGTLIGILHMNFDSFSDVVGAESTQVLFGRDHFYDEILGKRFRISPFSFFQTNTKGAEVLYQKVCEYIGEIKDAVVFDLYSGTGTISQLVSGTAKKVIGVEIVEEAVRAARENAAANGIENCEFICGDVLKVIGDIKEKPQYLILDPPREGINPKALGKIISFGAERIVYVSCKPTSLARDLELFLKYGYRAEKLCCVDMFPETVHVETVVLMSRVNK